MKTPRTYSWLICWAIFPAVLGAQTACAEGLLRSVRITHAVGNVDMLPGIVEPRQLGKLSIPSDGPLARIEVQEGDVVAAGQLLASVDSRVAEQAVHAATLTAEQQAQAASAANEVQAARRYLDRLLHAGKLRAASELEVDQARERLAQAEAAEALAREQRATASAQRELEQARLDAHRLMAPFSGRVLRIDAVLGQAVTRAVPVLTLADLTLLKVEIHVPVRWMRDMAVGQDYELAAEDPVRGFLTARLVHAEPTIDAATQTFRCVFQIENPTEELPAGFAVRLAAPKPVSEATSLSHRKHD